MILISAKILLFLFGGKEQSWTLFFLWSDKLCGSKFMISGVTIARGFHLGHAHTVNKACYRRSKNGPLARRMRTWVECVSPRHCWHSGMNRGPGFLFVLELLRPPCRMSASRPCRPRNFLRYSPLWHLKFRIQQQSSTEKFNNFYKRNLTKFIDEIYRQNLTIFYT